jgi:hypothetical protein
MPQKSFSKFDQTEFVNWLFSIQFHIEYIF